MSYFSKFEQNVKTSVLNSSTGNLDGGDTYTGLADSTYGVSGIQVNLYSDKNCTVYIEQSPDTTPTGPHWDISDNYAYVGGASFGITVQATSAYVRVRVSNDEAAPTNEFRVLTVLCPIIEAVPRTLTQHGNFRVSIDENKATVFTSNSKTDLTGSQVWAGDFEEVINQSAIQLIAKFTQDFTLYVDQGQDGVNADITDSWECLANTGISYAIMSIAPYYRIRLTNKSTSAATGSMTSAATSILSILPRKLDTDGCLITCIDSIHGRMGHDVIVSPGGGIKTESSVRLAGASFVGATVDSNFWTGVVTNGGAVDVTTNPASATIKTNTTANGGYLMNSVRIGRYIGASPNYYRGNVRLPVVTTGSAGHINTRRWGAFDTTNGFFFKAVQTNPAITPTLSIVCRKATAIPVDTNTVDSGYFNGNYGPYFTLDNSIHTYEIFWTTKAVYFVVDDVLLHTITGSTAALIDTFSLKIGLECANTGNNNAANTLVVRSSTINRLGLPETRPIWKYYAGTLAATVLKYGPGILHKVVVNKAGTSISLFDDTNTGAPANPICVIDTNKTTGVIGVGQYDLDFYNGLIAVIAGSGSDTTIIYE
jgi:hypothetical protein